MNRERHAFRDGVNNYVPGMQFSHSMVLGQPTAFTLGSPTGPSSNNIMAAFAANALATIAAAYTADSPYGRTARVTPSADPGATGGTVILYGRDYLGQPLAETFSGTNGSTAVIYGKKAFYKVTQAIVTVASTNAVNWTVGTAFRLGLPYKGDVEWAKEGGSLVELYKRDVTLYQSRSSADAVAGNSVWFRSPCAGFVKTLVGTPNGGGGATDPVVTVKLGGVAITGLTVTIDTSDTAGTTVTGAPTTAGYNSNNRVRQNSLIEVVCAAAAGAHGDTVGIVITPTQYTPADTTDPQTLSTGDPRGTYESMVSMAGATEIIVGLLGDNAVNAAGNGGLHGIKHVQA